MILFKPKLILIEQLYYKYNFIYSIIQNFWPLILVVLNFRKTNPKKNIQPMWVWLEHLLTEECDFWRSKETHSRRGPKIKLGLFNKILIIYSLVSYSIGCTYFFFNTYYCGGASKYFFFTITLNGRLEKRISSAFSSLGF